MLNVAIQKQEFTNKISAYHVTDEKFPLNKMIRTPINKSKTLNSVESTKLTKMTSKIEEPAFFKQRSNISTQDYETPIRNQAQ